jgi:anti-sigma factor RsiW
VLRIGAPINDAMLADYVSGKLTVMQFYAVYLALEHDPAARERVQQMRDSIHTVAPMPDYAGIFIRSCI